MAHVTQTFCDECGSDITTGQGRMWRLAVMSEVIGMAEGTTPLHDAGAVLPMQHFCNEKCLAEWAAAVDDRKVSAQVDFEHAQALAQAEAEAKVRGDAEENA